MLFSLLLKLTIFRWKIPLCDVGPHNLQATCAKLVGPAAHQGRSNDDTEFQFFLGIPSGMLPQHSPGRWSHPIWCARENLESSTWTSDLNS